MELHILIDNQPHQCNTDIAYEHGLSVYFSSDGKNYLADTGASGKFMHNMELLKGQGICTPAEVDHVIISHGHNDHTGGLRKFLEENTNADVLPQSGIYCVLPHQCRVQFLCHQK